MENNDMSEIINKISSIMNNSSSSSKEGNSSSSISPETVSKMVQILQQNNNDNKKEQDHQSNTTPSNSIDMETLLKFKTIFDKMNSKDDERSKLLLALKPYLKDSRKNKVDKYIQFLNLSKVIDSFGNSAIGGDKN